MINPLFKFTPVLCVLLMLALLAGCGGKSPSVAYYSLAPLAQKNLVDQPKSHDEIALGIGPVMVPEYLKRSQIATRVGDTRRYEFNEFHRWAGIIEKDIAAVVGNNLGLLLGTNKIAYFPWVHLFKPTYRIVVEMIQFDADLNGDAVLSVRWAISDGAGENILASGKSDYRQTLANPGYDALVDAENLLLAELSEELAKTVGALVLSL